jgi:hypothetical protein
MPAIVPIVSFKKEPFSSNKVRARVLNEMKRQAKIAKAYMALTVEHWNDPPTFTDKILYAKASPVLIVFPDPSTGSWEGAQHWNEVNDGTDIRYVRMSSDFVPKTLYPGALGNNTPGEGGPVGISATGLPGIRARHWDDLIQQEMKNDFTLSIGQAIKEGLEKNE